MTTPNQSRPASPEALTRAVQSLIERNKALSETVAKLEGKVNEFDAVVPLDDRLNVKLRREAERQIPFFYNMDITLAAGSTAAVVQSIQIDQGGAFLLYNIQAAWRPTAGANAGLFMPASTAHPSAVLASQTSTTDWLSFVFSITEGLAQRLRNKGNIPGELLYRSDNGLQLPEPDVYTATTNIEITVTPLVAPANAGIITFTLGGVQLLGRIGGL